jgi:hypothetical protein
MILFFFFFFFIKDINIIIKTQIFWIDNGNFFSIYVYLLSSTIEILGTDDSPQVSTHTEMSSAS